MQLKDEMCEVVGFIFMVQWQVFVEGVLDFPGP